MRPRRGYVLVMVLALLVLSATLLVALSRVAGRTALAARSAEEELQQRWGVASCRKAVLPHVEQILSALEQERRRPVARFSISVRLGGQTFEMILADEQAKANVNAILENSDATRAETRIRQGLTGSGLSNRIKLRPTVGAVMTQIANPTTAPTSRPVVSSNGLNLAGWGQVFEGVPPVQLIGTMPGSRMAPVDLLTCWGNGAVNVKRTTDAALNLAAGRSLSGVEIGRLIEARDKLFEKRPVSSFAQSPVEALKELIVKSIGESLKNKGNLGLVEGSSCHSMWIISRTGRRDGYDLFVMDQANATRPVVWAYSW